MIDGTGSIGRTMTAPSHTRAAPAVEPRPGVEARVSLPEAGPAPVDGQRVAALRQALADGSYRIDPRGIAEAMLATDLGWAKPA